MAYQNTPVENGYQVAQQIANFAATSGWTVHRGSEETDPSGAIYFETTLSATDYPGYVTLAGYTSGVTLNGHRSYDATKRWWEQPDQYYTGYDNDGSLTNDTYERQSRCHCSLRVNPILSVHMFAGLSPTPYIYAAVEKEPGYYRHIAIGHFEKFGASLGGMFWDVSSIQDYYSSYHGKHRVPFLYNTNTYYFDGTGGFDAQDADGLPRWIKMGNSTPPGDYSVGGHWGSELNTILKCSPIQFNGRTPLVTPFVWVSNGGYRPYGTPPAFRYVSLEYFEAGDEMVIGTETWKVFPWARRKTGAHHTDYRSSSDEATGMFGIAYLKD